MQLRVPYLAPFSEIEDRIYLNTLLAYLVAGSNIPTAWNGAYSRAKAWCN